MGRVAVFLLAAFVVSGIPAERLGAAESIAEGMIVYGDDWAFAVKEPKGWTGDTKNAGKLYANAIFYRSTETINTMSTIIMVRVFPKFGEDTANDLAHDMDGYRAKFPKVKFEDLEVSHPDYHIFPKLYYVPDNFYEYVVYLNPGGKFKYGLSIAMNIQKRRATEKELKVFQKIVGTLIFMKKYDEKHPPPKKPKPESVPQPLKQ
jgi:hypothetical protein